MKSIIHMAIAFLFILPSTLPVLAHPDAAANQFSCSTVTEIPQLECEGLVALYDSTNGPGWTENTNWLVTNTPSDWYGVNMVSGHVARLHLSNNYLTGSIPAELGDLIGLEYFNFFRNQLSGSIPPELGNLTSIYHIALGENQLSGSIPPELGNLSSLGHLVLNNNQLSGSIPVELGALTNLASLKLSNNQLSGNIPPELGNLSQLHSLELSGNQLSGNILYEFGYFPYLEILRVNDNPNLAGKLPSSLINLPLIYFWYDNTGLCEPDDPAFQTWLSSIHVLQRTGLCRDMFPCEIIDEIPKLECEALVELYYCTNGQEWISKTNWLETDTPSNWFGVTLLDGQVSELDLYHNNLAGNIPAEMGDLTNLFSLILGDNQLSGSIPSQLGNLTELRMLNLGRNQLDGGIPLELGNLTKLTYLYLETNQISGEIPVELSLLTNLVVLDIGNNELTGSIPGELGNLTNLQDLALSENHLSGNVPAELGNLASLIKFNLAENNLSGSLPPELGSLTSLHHLILSGNLFSGGIPAELASLASLHTLALDDNQFDGSIPSELGNLTNLNYLWLQDNRLSGDVPATLVNLANLYDPGQAPGSAGLDLDYNMLSVPANYPDPGDPLQLFLSQKDPDWQLYQGFQQVIGVGGGEITSLDGRTDFIIPTGALITDTTFTFIPERETKPGWWWLKFLNNSFQLSAEDAVGNPVMSFNLPITVTLTYTNADFGAIAENTLGLYFWDEAVSGWNDAVTTCPGGEYTRDLPWNQLSLLMCHLTEFGLFGNPRILFLPVVRR